MNKKMMLFCFLLLALSAHGQRVRRADNSVNIHLRDGSNFRGERIAETRDSLYITNQILGELAVPKSEIRFSGDNYNNGKMIAVIPFFNAEKDDSFSSVPTYKLSFSSSFDERFAPTFDIGYRFQKFEQNTSKYLEPIEPESCEERVFEGNYSYQAHLLTPTINLRFSPLPSKALENLTQQYGIYPYLGFGVGYGVGFVKYEFTEAEFEFDDKAHHYFGMIYQGMVGISVRMSRRTAFVFEAVYENATFKQKLYSIEKNHDFEQDVFVLEGMKILLGIRFGRF